MYFYCKTDLTEAYIRVLRVQIILKWSLIHVIPEREGLNKDLATGPFPPQAHFPNISCVTSVTGWKSSISQSVNIFHVCKMYYGFHGIQFNYSTIFNFPSKELNSRSRKHTQASTSLGRTEHTCFLLSFLFFSCARTHQSIGNSQAIRRYYLWSSTSVHMSW